MFLNEMVCYLIKKTVQPIKDITEVHWVSIFLELLMVCVLGMLYLDDPLDGLQI